MDSRSEGAGGKQDDDNVRDFGEEPEGGGAWFSPVVAGPGVVKVGDK